MSLIGQNNLLVIYKKLNDSYIYIIHPESYTFRKIYYRDKIAIHTRIGINKSYLILCANVLVSILDLNPGRNCRVRVVTLIPEYFIMYVDCNVTTREKTERKKERKTEKEREKEKINHATLSIFTF